MNSIRANVARHGREVSRPTTEAYTAALQRLYVLEDLPSRFPSLRAKSRITSTPGRFMADPSIAVASDVAEVTVHLDGGDLRITVSEDRTVTMTGPAETVYEGEVQL